MVKTLTKFMILCIVLNASVKTFSQELQKNIHGDLILNYDDNSWRYFRFEKDYESIAKDDSASIVLLENNFVYRIENNNSILGQWLRNSFLTLNEYNEELDILKMDKKENKSKISDIKNLIQDLHSNIKIVENELKRMDSGLKLHRKYLKKSIKKRYKNLADLNKYSMIDSSINLKKSVELVLSTNAKTIDNIEEKKKVKHKEKRKEKEKKNEEYVIEPDDTPEIYNDQDEEEKEEQIIIKNSTFLDPNKEYMDKPINLSKINTPPKYNCRIAFEGEDELLKKNRKDLEYEHFFTSTPEQMKSILHGKDYMTTYAHLSSLSGGHKFLFLKIEIASPNASKEFGLLERGSMMAIQLLNGTLVQLYNKQTDKGIYNNQTHITTYKAKYRVPVGAESDLLKSEIDKVRINWSSGYEDYEIFNIDLFINQLNCL